MQEILILWEAVSCLIASETISWKNLVPEYTAKPANACNKLKTLKTNFHELGSYLKIKLKQIRTI